MGVFWPDGVGVGVIGGVGVGPPVLPPPPPQPTIAMSKHNARSLPRYLRLAIASAKGRESIPASKIKPLPDFMYECGATLAVVA